MQIHRNNSPVDYTEQYIEDKRKDILSHNRKRSKAILRTLFKHCTEPDSGTLVPEQIKFMIRCLIETALLFEEESLETFNNLPEEDKIKLEADYLSTSSLDYINNYSPLTNRGTPVETIKSFYTRQEELDKSTREKAIDYLNRTT